MEERPTRISDFTLRNLRTFCIVAEHGSFLGAQSVLGISQPAISAHIKDLEVGLGFPLCRRGRAGFALTEKGEAVYARAKEMLAGVEDCEARLGELRRSLSGHLRIGLVDSEAANPELPIADAIHRFFSRDQDVQLTFEIGAPDTLGRALSAGDIQIAIGPFPTKLPSIDYEPIYEETHALFCGHRHPLFDTPAETVTMGDLARYSMTIRPYLRHAELAGWETPRVVAAVSNMEAQAILIASGCFLGFLPTHYARPWMERGEMRSFDHLGLEWRSKFFLATRSGPRPTQIVSVLLKDLRHALRRPGGSGSV